jgi:hypothetical protein
MSTSFASIGEAHAPFCGELGARANGTLISEGPAHK